MAILGGVLLIVSSGLCLPCYGQPPVVPPGSIAWAPDSRRLLVLRRKSVCLRDLVEKVDRQLPTERGECNWRQPVWSPDGELVAACAEISGKAYSVFRIKIWNSRSRVCLRSIEVASGVGTLLWSRDGKAFLYSQPGMIKVMSPATGDTIRTIATDECVSFSYSPKGNYIAFQDGSLIQILDAVSMNAKLTLQGPKSGAYGFDWSPDERFVLIAGRQTVAVFDATSGEAVGFQSWPDLDTARWSPDGSTIRVSMNHSEPRVVPVNLGNQLTDASILEGGKAGGPGWENAPCPRNLEQCFAEFDRCLTSEERMRFMRAKEDEIGDFGGGSIITDSLMANVFHRWSLVELRKFFEQKGITYSKDQFGIVLNCYWRYLNEKPLQLDEQVRAHLDWWRQKSPVVEENRSLTEEFLGGSSKDSRGGSFSIGALKSKLKIVSFIDSDGLLSAEQLRSLQSLRQRYQSEDLSFVVFVVPPENLTVKRWRFIKRVMEPQMSEDPGADIAAFRRDPGQGFLVARAPNKLCQAFQNVFADLSNYTLLGPPQTLVITSDGILKLRLNGFDKDETEKALEHEIREVFKLSD